MILVSTMGFSDTSDTVVEIKSYLDVAYGYRNPK